MNKDQQMNHATTALVVTLARTLIAQGVIQKEDLTADLDRQLVRNDLPEGVSLLLRALLTDLPNQ